MIQAIKRKTREKAKKKCDKIDFLVLTIRKGQKFQPLKNKIKLKQHEKNN